MSRVVVTVEIVAGDVASAPYRQALTFEPKHPELAVPLARYLADGIRQQIGLARIFDGLRVEPGA